jgi:hypothetical protein
MDFFKTAAEEIADVSMDLPHVVLLGAGASRAAFPNGDASGRRLPLMDDLCRLEPVEAVLSAVGISAPGRNFEELVAELAVQEGRRKVLDSLEAAIFDYFSGLRLPSVPTIYDHLILSLRPKDVIATFNWDPFLIQAAQRNGRIGGVPQLAFLHGNVLEAFCEEDQVMGVRGRVCSRCGRPFSPGRLLYPITEKDYDSDPAVRSSWKTLKGALKSAFMVTVFGYSAPTTDVRAIDLLDEAWGGSQKREMEQFEIIDIRPEEDLTREWDRFINTHHYEVHSDFVDSWIAKHPRRSGEAYFSQFYDAQFIHSNPAPLTDDFDALWGWFASLVSVEAR